MRGMTTNEIASVRFHIRCSVRLGRDDDEILLQLRRVYGYRPELEILLRQYREIVLEQNKHQNPE